jgi:hypothetical protein
MFAHPIANVVVFAVLAFVLAAVAYTVEAVFPRIVEALRGKGGWEK